MTAKPPHIAVVGAGPAGLMAAQGLARGGGRVTVIDRMPSVARKFLMAGRGGLNLTHSEPQAGFLARYGAAADPRLLAAIDAFPPKTQIKWAEGLGQETFIGSSGRVFPKAMKASPLLRAWLAKLDGQGVVVRTRTAWRGFAPDGVLLQKDGDPAPQPEAFDAVVLALGGASWPRLGSDGGWRAILQADGQPTVPFAPANAGIHVAWSDITRTKHAGAPLKRITLTVAGTPFRGEAIVTRQGLEGGVIYAANEAIRAAFNTDGARIMLDLRSDLSVAELAKKLAKGSPKDTQSNRLRKAGGLSPAAIAVLRDGVSPIPRDPHALAAAIKAVPLVATGFGGLDRAISSTGGLAFDAIDGRWMLKTRPGVFVCGEMLDWTAPTGGYLLTACLATGRAAAEGCLAWLGERAPPMSVASDVAPAA